MHQLSHVALIAVVVLLLITCHETGSTAILLPLIRPSSRSGNKGLSKCAVLPLSINALPKRKLRRPPAIAEDAVDNAVEGPTIKICEEAIADINPGTTKDLWRSAMEYLPRLPWYPSAQRATDKEKRKKWAESKQFNVDELRKEDLLIQKDMEKFHKEPVIWTVNGNRTEVMVYTGLNPSTVMIFLPGNPGIAEGYHTFLQTIFSSVQSLDVIGVSYLGHNQATCGGKVLSLNDEIEHQFATYEHIKTLYPENTKFILAGHSTGALMSLSLMEKYPNDPIIRAFAIFPAIDDLMDSPRGAELKAIADFPLVFATLITSLRTVLGEKTFSSFIQGQFPDIPRHFNHIAINKLFHSGPMYNSMLVFRQTAERTKVFNEKLVERFVDRLTFFYSTEDHWIPYPNRANRIKSKFPDGEVIICEKSGAHEFKVLIKDPINAGKQDFVEKDEHLYEEPISVNRPPKYGGGVPHDFVYHHGWTVGQMVVKSIERYL